MSETNETPTTTLRTDRRATRDRTRVQKSRQTRGLLVFVALLALIVLLGVAEGIASAGRIHPGVDVAGIPVGGLSVERAERTLKVEHAKRASRPVIVVHDGAQFAATSAGLMLRFDARAEAAEAYKVGRRDGMLKSLAERVAAWRGRAEIAPVPEADTGKLDAFIDQVAKATDVAPVDAHVVIKGSKASAVDGKDGLGLQRTLLARRVIYAFAEEERTPIPAPVTVARKRVGLEAAEQAAAITTTMISRPASVRYDKQKWDFEPDEVAEWIDFRAVETTAMSSAGVVLEPFVSPERAEKLVTKRIGSKVGRPAVDARFKTSNGEVTIVPSKDGVGPDVESLSLSLTEELKDSSADRVVELRTRRKEPKITTEEARGMGIKERISTFTTTYGSSNRPRVNNIHVLGDALDGTLIEPGGVFSFNGAAGERTAERGYQEASAIVNGKLVPQLGGGVCQVGTTVFNAAFESGLPVIERRNHSFYISHYPTGRDATVSWGGPDLKFKNDTKKWILVSVSYTSGSITVSLYGTDPGYEVEAEVGKWTNMRPYGIEKVKDPKLEVGMNYVEDPGIKGRSITVKRIVSKNGKVVRTDTFVSNYKPKVEVVKVGTKRSGSTETSKTP